MKKWKLLKHEDVSPSKWFPLYKDTVELPNGKVFDDYYVSALGHVATIIPILDDGRIIWVRQYKHGVGQVTIELPAGRIQQSLSTLETAKAELKEETGYTAKNFFEIGYVCPIPSKDGSLMYGFVATELENTGETKFDETEDIELLLLTKDEVLEKLRDGEIIGSDAIALFFKAILIYPELFEQKS